MRTIAGIMFPIVIFALGSALQMHGGETGNTLLSEIGYSIMGGPLIFCGVVLIVHIFWSLDGTHEFLRVWHLAIGVTLLGTIAMGLAQPLVPVEALKWSVWAFVASVWITYLGVRLIIEGTLIRKKEDEEDAPMGI